MSDKQEITQVLKFESYNQAILYKDISWLVKCPNGEHAAFKNYITIIDNNDNEETYSYCSECDFHFIDKRSE